MVFQDYALFPHLSVSRNIAYGLESRKTSSAVIREKVTGLLALVKLEGYEDRAIHQLSGGERQRVALARALAPEPELLLFDEPLSALDVKLRKQLRREIRSIQEKIGFTAVYVTHDQEEAMSISDRIAVMKGGRIRQCGTPERIYENPADYFTADFIGTMNMLTLSQEGGPEERIMFRPEDCRLLPENHRGDQAAGTLTIGCEAVCSEYRGGYYSSEALTGSGELIRFNTDEKLHPGSKAAVRIERFSRF